MPRNTLAHEDYRRRMIRVLVHIENHLDDDQALSLDDLADVACFSRYHFHRIFTGMVGESVRSYIRRIFWNEPHTNSPTRIIQCSPLP